MLVTFWRVIGLAFLFTVLAAPVADVAWVDENKQETKSLLGSYLAGRMARSQRENSKAATYYEKALEKDPENDVILERAFLLEAIAGDWDAAIRLAKDVAANEPSHQIARFLLGVKAFKDGDYKTAVANFSSARKSALPDLTARLSIAWTYLAEGKSDLALKELDQMKKADWSRFYQQYHRGLIADLAGKKKTAQASFANAFKSRPRTLRIAEAYVRHAASEGDMKLAKQILQKHIGTSAGHPIARALLADVQAGRKPEKLVSKPSDGMAEVFYAIGDALTGEDSTEIGLVYLRIALYLKPDFPLAHLAIGEVHDKMDQFADAIVSFNKIPSSSPIWNNVQIRKAYALNSQEKIDEAKAILQDLGKRMPGDVRPLDALGSIMRARQRYKEAEAAYTSAIEQLKNPQKRHWSIYYARGVSRERLKDWPGAESDLKMALKLNPEQPLILNYLGYSWVDQGLYLGRAMDLIRKAVKLKPDDGYFVDSLGWAYYRLGNFKEAAKKLERAVELRPEDPVINDHLGDAYWRVGRFLEAKYQWSQALTLEPEPEDEKVIKDKIANGMTEIDKTKAIADKADPAKKSPAN